MTDLADLTRYQLDLLYALAHEAPCSGQTAGSRVAASFGTQRVTGALYRSLDALADAGLVEVRRKHYDDRTNAYDLTAAGRHALREDAQRRVNATEALKAGAVSGGGE